MFLLFLVDLLVVVMTAVASVAVRYFRFCVGLADEITHFQIVIDFADDVVAILSLVATILFTLVTLAVAAYRQIMRVVSAIMRCVSAITRLISAIMRLGAAVLRLVRNGICAIRRLFAAFVTILQFLLALGATTCGLLAHATLALGRVAFALVLLVCLAAQAVLVHVPRMLGAIIFAFLHALGHFVVNVTHILRATTMGTRYIVAMASTTTLKTFTAIGSLAVSIPLPHAAVRRVVRFRIRLEIAVVNVPTPHAPTERIANDMAIAWASDGTGDDQLHTTALTTKTQPSTTSALATTKTTITQTPLALMPLADSTLGVHVDASSPSVVGAVAFALVDRRAAAASSTTQAQVIMPLLVAMPLPLPASALSLVWYSPAVEADAVESIQPAAIEVSGSIVSVEVLDTEEAVEAVEAKCLEQVATDDTDTGSSGDSAASIDPESESEPEPNDPWALRQDQLQEEEQALGLMDHQEPQEPQEDEEAVRIRINSTANAASSVENQSAATTRPRRCIARAPPSQQASTPMAPRLRRLRPTLLTPTASPSSTTSSVRSSTRSTRRARVNLPLNYNPNQQSRLLVFMRSDKWASICAENKQRRATAKKRQSRA